MSSDLRDTQAKFRQAHARSGIFLHSDDALNALNVMTRVLPGADELEQLRDGINHRQNELATAHAIGCVRTAG
jgi:hypothetical protein